MSRYWHIFFLFMLVLSIPATVIAGGIEVEVDGKTIEFNNFPCVEGGRVLVPMREFFTTMGAEVYWDDKTRTASAVKNNVRVSIPVGSCLPTIDEVPVPIDVPAKIINNNVYIPLRFAAEYLGGKVNWDAGSRIVSVTTAARAVESRGKERDTDNIYGGKIDINSAGMDELLEIDGVSEALAGEILSYRNAHGFYGNFDEIRSLPSMTSALFEEIRANIIILYREKGQCCYYGDEFQGRKTTSGEVYDKHLYTAAHRTLPFGTMVKVFFPKTGQSVWVRINDRGPHVPGRIIDLSGIAADAIGLTPYGVGWVELEAILEG